MSVKIRLTRIGRIHRPFYRIGVYDSRTARDGKALEYVGHYDPVGTTAEPVRVDLERVKAWIAKGAEVTDQVGRILKGAGLPTSKRVRNTTRNKAHATKRKVARAAKKTARKSAKKS